MKKKYYYPICYCKSGKPNYLRVIVIPNYTCNANICSKLLPKTMAHSRKTSKHLWYRSAPNSHSVQHLKDGAIFIHKGHSGACLVSCYLKTGPLHIKSWQFLPRVWSDSSGIYCTPWIFNLPKFSHMPFLHSVHWLPGSACIRFNTLMLTYKTPIIPKALITLCYAAHTLPASSMAQLDPPFLKVQGQYASGLLSVLTLRWGNELFLIVRIAKSLAVFKQRLKTYIFTNHSNIRLRLNFQH